jgi:hypothetical protein
MGRSYLVYCAVVSSVLTANAWSQTDRVDPNLDNPNPSLTNPDPNLGDPNPHLNDPNPNLNATQPDSGGSNVNPTMQPDNAQPFGNPNVGQGVMNGQNNAATPQNLSGAAAVDNNWRMVQHNGRWWYWTPENNWLYRRGDEWMAYHGRNTARDNLANRNFNNQRQRVGFRGDGTMDPRLNGGAAVRGGTNYSNGTTTFDGTRPPLPTALELQRFQAQQQTLNTPYGGTMGGARNQTAPLGGGTTRANTFGTAPGGLGSPGNPNAVPQANPVSPGNPSAMPQTAPGNTGNPATSGGASPAGGVGTAPGTSGVGGAGAGGTGAGGTGG